MTIVVRPVAILAIAALCVSPACGRRDNGEYGGEPERHLVAATVAVDVARVQQLLTSGADPNKMAPHDGHQQSAWKLALRQVRPDKPETIAIVRAMLERGARPDVAWGEGPSVRGGYTAQRGEPMLDAISNGSAELARALMQARLDPRLAAVALGLAVENRQADIVHVLVEAGVDVNTTARGITPLVSAIEARDVALMTYLEDRGAREKP
ncbi:MAG TPA: ankyrin repeat domain-containing protein [Vicinamibacterales bacterium]|jgi:hypothetical protein|nr:ankyrin repeat domain-containing protein [Vicinamibacterales bacterium]